MLCFSIQYQHQYLPLPVYEVPAIRVNTTKSMLTFTSVDISILKLHYELPKTVEFCSLLFGYICVFYLDSTVYQYI